MTTISEKQLNILRCIVRGNPDGSQVDIYQIMKRVDHKASREALHCSLRSMATKRLISKGSFEVRQGRKMQTYLPTASGYNTLKSFTK